MKIIILGAGGIGSLVGALLSKKNDVLLVGKKPHADAISKNGLKIEGCINETFRVKAAEEIKELNGDEIIVLSTKVGSSEEAINSIKNKLKKLNVVICLQNGLGNEDIVKKLVGCRVIRAITTAGTTFLEAGKISCSNVGNIFLEESDASEKLAKEFSDSGIPTESDPKIKEKIWKKLIVNCALNPLTAIFRVRNGELERCPELVRSVVEECVKVAAKDGIRLDAEETYKWVMKVIMDSAANISSMHQDILMKRKTEISFLNGKVVELAKKHGIEAPVNEALVRMIGFVESNLTTK
ncbi:2-dehydropantoate 2-reductase [Candidatus Woesearchaeota archaeon]|nr:2-dehydropantoate 2-reductase [Candidatus Woesearchaeota archaeon]